MSPACQEGWKGRMKRTISLILFAILISSGALAQSISTITIGTSPIGAQFIVDGSAYVSNQVFAWPTGSKHIVQFPFSTDINDNTLSFQSALSDNIHYTFSGWTASNGLLGPASSPIVTVTAGPGLTSLIASVSVQYKVNIIFGDSNPDLLNPNCGGAPANPTTARQGIMYLDGVCFGDTANVFVTKGVHTLNAFPYPGWVFYGWLINSSQPAFLTTYDIESPATIEPQFSIGKRVNFITNPLGLQVIIDGSPIYTPSVNSQSSDGVTCAPDFTRLPPNAPPGFTPLCAGQFDFLPGSVHHIGAQPAQIDSIGNFWSFSGFSNGLGQNAVYVAPSNTNVPDTITANFVPGVHVDIMTQPAGLKVQIDGRDNWPGYTFVWGAGETHTINAESPQTDAHGRVWTFQGWSDTGAQSHTITVPGGATGYVVTATYSGLAQITFGSSPGAFNFSVDGANCVTPCVTNRALGSTIQVTAPSSVPAGTGARFDFASWSDGVTTPSRSVTFSQSTASLTATYQTSYQVSALTNPANAGTFQLAPSSPDGFYASGAQVVVTAVANSGFKFAHWEDDLSGSFATGSLLMNSPHTVQADFATVPTIPKAGIQSVTGPTPDGSVAAGSIISIYGQNLSATFVIGPNHPLSQALGNVTVTVGDSLLPLVFVSSTQIAAQVPWEFAPGDYTLVVHQTGLPDVSGALAVTRNAPGAFLQANDQNQPLVLALHQDGSLVTFASPAKRGEQISIYTTGLGAYDHPAVDCFPASSTDTFNVLDPVMINTDASQMQSDWAGAAVGIVGVQVVKLTITPDMPSGTNLNLTINANGKNSTQVVLPLQ
jgi:uncharacterized protein (TIGR03437 family)